MWTNAFISKKRRKINRNTVLSLKGKKLQVAFDIKEKIIL